MPDSRCFRIDEDDIDDLRERTRDQSLIDAYADWARHFAPQLDSVLTKITDAFANSTLGDGVGLFEANGLDDYADRSELRRLRSLDEKLDWKRITTADLSRCYCSPTFFDPLGFVFHLPAFLTAELNDEHPYGFIDRLFAAGEHPEGWRQLLTNEQRDAIIATLELIRNHPDYHHHRRRIEKSLASYIDAKNLG